MSYHLSVPWFLCLTLILVGMPLQAVGAITAKKIATIGIGSGPELRHPSDVLVNSRGEIFVLDGVNNRVVHYDAQGQYLNQFGKGGSKPGEFNNPLGMAMNRDGNLYVADTGNSRVQFFSSDGQYLHHIELPHDGDGRKPDPTDVAIDDVRNKLYVVDNDNHKVLVYDLKQKRFKRYIGGMGMKGGELRWPFSIKLDRQGRIFVVDVINTTVKSYLPDEKRHFDASIGKWGVERGELFRPKGVAIDDRDEVYISDSFLGVIQVFDNQGRFLSVLLDEEGQLLKFITPTRLHFDQKGLLYVVEMFAHRVTLYEIGR
ncbi:MAG: NHL repeat-containing protein [Candidatus Polarisedimenticolaceae bacterium]|nr:NHL repeat-containing protein [Candidatus Polarisedimenticolaceae bacterium]